MQQKDDWSRFDLPKLNRIYKTISYQDFQAQKIDLILENIEIPRSLPANAFNVEFMYFMIMLQTNDQRCKFATFFNMVFSFSIIAVISSFLLLQMFCTQTDQLIFQMSNGNKNSLLIVFKKKLGFSILCGIILKIELK